MTAPVHCAQWTEGARDNLKFLATLERHFEVLETGTLIAVADAMAPLMAALRMVWIISRHYGDDERMKALFSRIACKLADRVEAAVQTQVCNESGHAVCGCACQRRSSDTS